VRWKLLIITSLVAALISVGGMHALNYWLSEPLTHLSEQPALSAGLIVIPLALSTLASIFVYRHTARRRKLQATITVILSITLTVIVVFIVAETVMGRPAEESHFKLLSLIKPRDSCRVVCG
jgi:heme/copper-type cytochrome/quinol oxidase subunit 2